MTVGQQVELLAFIRVSKCPVLVSAGDKVGCVYLVHHRCSLLGQLGAIAIAHGVGAEAGNEFNGLALCSYFGWQSEASLRAHGAP